MARNGRERIVRVSKKPILPPQCILEKVWISQGTAIPASCGSRPFRAIGFYETGNGDRRRLNSRALLKTRLSRGVLFKGESLPPPVALPRDSRASQSASEIPLGRTHKTTCSRGIRVLAEERKRHALTPGGFRRAGTKYVTGGTSRQKIVRLLGTLPRIYSSFIFI